MAEVRTYGSGAEAISRRRFVRASGALLGAGLLGAGAAPLSGCSQAASMLSGEREVVDDVGRTVVIPSADRLERVYFTSPLAQIFCFTVDPSLAGGTCTVFDADQLEFLPEGTGDLINMGSLSAGGAIDREALIYNDIQLIFSISAPT